MIRHDQGLVKAKIGLTEYLLDQCLAKRTLFDDGLGCCSLLFIGVTALPIPPVMKSKKPATGYSGSVACPAGLTGDIPLALKNDVSFMI